jgi:hypothetical protein
MPVEGFVVISLVAVAIVLIATLMIVNRNRYKWPKGYLRESASYKGCKVTVLVPGNGAEGLKKLAFHCAKAAYAMKVAWLWPEGVEPDKKALDSVLRWTVCWLKTDDEFEKVVRTWNASFPVTYPAAHTGFIRPRSGSGAGLPAAIIRYRYLSTIETKGAPFDHELTHHLEHELLGTWDRDHVVPNMWTDVRSRFLRAFEKSVFDKR